MHHVTLRSRLRSRMTRRSKSKKATSEGMKFPKNFRYWPILVIVSSIMLLLVTFRMAPKSSSSAAMLGGDIPASGNSFKNPQSPDEMMVRRFGKRSAVRSNDEEYDYDESTKLPGRGSGSGKPRYRSRTRRKAMKRLRSKGSKVKVTSRGLGVTEALPAVSTEVTSAAKEQESTGQEETTIYDLEDPTTQAPVPNYDHMGMFPVYPFF